MNNTSLHSLVPTGYTSVLCTIHEDASAINLQLDCNGNRVCGNFVNNRWDFYVPQNKLRTAKMSREQLVAIKEYANGVHHHVGNEWHSMHKALYGVN